MASPSPENDDRKPAKGPRRPPRRFPRSEQNDEQSRPSPTGPWTLFLLLLFVAAALWFYSNDPSNVGSEVDYTFFREQVEADARRAVALEPEHLSTYALTLEREVLAEDTPLAKRLARGEVALPQDEEVVAMAATLREVYAAHGLRRYEISNHAREGYSSRHNALYWTGGAVGVAIALWCWLAYPRFEGRVVQRRHLVLRSRYWLYYALVFMSGARRQIFVVFAAFMMVEKFGLRLHDMAWLFTINYAANMVFAPAVGQVLMFSGH